MDLSIIIFPIIAILILFIGIWIFFRILRGKSRIVRSLNMALFLVSVPREEPKEAEEAKKTEKEFISVMEQLYSTLSNVKGKKIANFLYGQPHIALELAVESEAEEICFYIAVPRSYQEVIEKQIHGVYPKASVERVRDYNIFNSRGKSACCRLGLAKKGILPIKTYQQLESDPLGTLASALSKIEAKGEGAAVQLLIRPAKSGWQKFAIQVAKRISEGKNFGQAVGASELSKTPGELLKITGETLKAKPKEKPLVPGEKPYESVRLSPLQEEMIKALEAKASKVGFETNIRLVTSAATKERAEEILGHLKGAFTQFTSPLFNQFKIPKTYFPKGLAFDFIFRNFNPRHAFILNTEELASIYHLPTPFSEVGKVKFVKAKTAPIPANMPKEGLVLGKNLYRGEEKQVKMLKDDRRRHLYVIGQTGTGKSTFLGELIRQDIEAGEGVGVVDPHGDLIEQVLANIPESRAEDVVLFEPFDILRPIGLNMLDYKTDEQRDFAVSEMINIFHKLFPPEYVGPMCEHYMRNAMLTLMADKVHPGTLCEIPRILTDEEFTKYKVAKVTDPMVRAFWEKEWAKTSEFHKSEMLGYLISKIGAFVENEMMRNIIGQEKSGFDFREVMDKQKILLVNLSKGRVGELNSSLLGLIIVSKLQMAAMGRVDISQEERKDFYLYMDEFQNFTTETVATILAEARKYRLCLIIAHQFIGQLDEKIKNAVFGNVGSTVSFRIGPEDAEFVVKEFEPVFNTNDLINIDNFDAYVKLMIGGGISRAFSMQTYPPKEGSPEVARATRVLSRLKYGHDKSVVEKEILERSKLGASAGAEGGFMAGEKKL